MQVAWTGPASSVDSSRLTAPVVAGLVDGATAEIVLASFAVHPDDLIDTALRSAADRGVDITLVLERPADNPHFKSFTDAFPGLPARRLVWPLDRRPAGAALHAKVIVVDGRDALVGSANLTGRAMDDNLECGVLIRGGAAPRAIRDHLFGLLYGGELERR